MNIDNSYAPRPSCLKQREKKHHTAHFIQDKLAEAFWVKSEIWLWPNFNMTKIVLYAVERGLKLQLIMWIMIFIETILTGSVERLQQLLKKWENCYVELGITRQARTYQFFVA